MLARDHQYRVTVRWTGNLGTGTWGYGAYSRNHAMHGEGKAPIAGSSDPVFRGEADGYNPEELLVASLGACHRLWFLHLCADAGVIVPAYEDTAAGAADRGRRGAFADSTLLLAELPWRGRQGRSTLGA
jgi:organic hydroperoxide reductase OsmC/OhrA